MIRMRGEEDLSVWERLQGAELEKAKQMILDVLPGNQECYMRAVSITKDKRAIDKLKITADDARDLHARAYAAKILFDWTGYKDYEQILDEVFESDNQWSKTSLDYWIAGLPENLALKYFRKAMNDKDSFVRYCAYEALERYYGVWEFRNSGVEIKYFTDEEVYQDKEIFLSRQKELEEKIRLWSAGIKA